MDIQVVGINHKTTPIEIREKFFFSVTQQELLLSEFKSQPAVVEAMILSTCNRTEVYYCALSSRNNPEEIIRTLFSAKNIKDSNPLKNSFYHYTGEEAVRHLFRVSAGMDSLVLGERQILGQVKDAVTLARKKAMLGKYLNILTNMAIRTAKKAHNETRISIGGVSISWAAVVMAEKVFETLKGKSVLILGAGKMSHLATEQIYKKGAAKIFIMNRTESCAMTLAELYKGEAVSFCDIKEALSQVDLCICSVGAPHYILERPTVEKVMQQREDRPLVFIDISMPRNIDPQVAMVPGVLLFHVDDLDNVVSESMKKRQAAAVGAEKIITEKVLQFYQKIGRLNKNISSDYFTANLNS